MVVKERNVTRKSKTCSQEWQALISARMWPIKEKEKKAAAHILAKSYSLYQAEGMRRYGSLINIKPSEQDKEECIPI